MCEFVSWVEQGEKVFFLTGDQLFRTERGRTCREQMGSSDDYTGHGAIRLYYGLKGSRGVDKECSDFGKPENFPMEIRLALLDGSMKGFQLPRGILRKSLTDDYLAKGKPLTDDYLAKLKPLDDDYLAKGKSLDDDYLAKWKSLDDDYLAKWKSLTDDYEAKLKPLDDEQWELVKDPANCAEAWQ